MWAAGSGGPFSKKWFALPQWEPGWFLLVQVNKAITESTLWHRHTCVVSSLCTCRYSVVNTSIYSTVVNCGDGSKRLNAGKIASSANADFAQVVVNRRNTGGLTTSSSCGRDLSPVPSLCPPHISNSSTLQFKIKYKWNRRKKKNNR